MVVIRTSSPRCPAPQAVSEQDESNRPDYDPLERLAAVRATFFDRATADGDRSVALMMQADMFDPTVPDLSISDYSALTPIVRTIAERATGFDGPVYLFDGDSHAYHQDRPLATGSRWPAFHGVTAPAGNLTR